MCLNTKNRCWYIPIICNTTIIIKLFFSGIYIFLIDALQKLYHNPQALLGLVLRTLTISLFQVKVSSLVADDMVVSQFQ